jgi:hypothetical protein
VDRRRLHHRRQWASHALGVAVVLMIVLAAVLAITQFFSTGRLH